MSLIGRVLRDADAMGTMGVVPLIITDVNWYGIPKSAWGLVLEDIQVGRCVTRLPMKTYGNKRFRIALPEKTVRAVGLGDAVSAPERPEIEFEQVMLSNKTIVWQRIR